MINQYQFLNPPPELRPIPFWVWNGDMQEEVIEMQIEEMYDKGIREFLIHPRYGLEIPYLSEDFFEKVTIAVRKAERKKMKVWLYDEYNWPSGTVAGKILREHPEYQMTYLHYHLQKIDPSERQREIEFNISEGELLLAEAVNTSTWERKDISTNIRGENLIWNAPRGKWVASVFLKTHVTETLDFARGREWVKPVPGYVDVLNPDAIKYFIQHTHEEYFRHLGKYFGKVIKGIFNDEPGLIYDFDFTYQMEQVLTCNLPWSEMLSCGFKKIKGYNLLSHLIDLIVDTPTSVRTRCDYWEVITELYSQSYHGQIKQWCKNHDIAYIGHLVWEHRLDFLEHYQGDYFLVAKQYHIPGIDWFIDSGFVHNQYIGAKLASSTAHQTGSLRVHSETYDCGGWGLTLNNMKRVADWLYALGINMLLVYGYWYSIKGFRKYECPPSEFFQMPWWRYTPLFSHYIGRLGLLLTEGVHKPSVAVLFPTTSYWSRNNSSLSDVDWQIMQTGLENISEALLRVHLNYDYLFESCFLHGEIQEGTVKIGEETVSTIVLPPVKILSKEILEKLLLFCRGGGTIIAYGMLPEKTRDGNDISDIVQDIFGLKPSEVNQRIRNSKSRILKSYNNSITDGRAIYLEGNPSLVPVPLLERKMKEIVKLRMVDITVPGSDKAREIVYHQRSSKQREIYFFFNTSSKKINDITISLREHGIPEIWDHEDGSIKSIGYINEKNGIRISVSLEPYQSIFVVVKKSKLNTTETSDPIFHLSKKTKTLLCLEKRDWTFHTLFPNLLRIKDWINIPTGDLSTYRVVANVYADFVPEDLFLCYEQGYIKDIHINGHRISYSQCQPSKFLRMDVQEVRVTRYFLKWKNVIVAIYTPPPAELIKTPHISLMGKHEDLLHLKEASSYYVIDIPFVYLRGTFSITPNLPKTIISPITTLKHGSWVAQGYPEYAGTGVYETNFEFLRKKNNNRLYLEVDVGEDVVEVWLNKKRVGTRAWFPYILDISRYIREGTNELELRITNTAANLWEAPKPSGLLGRVVIFEERVINHGYHFNAGNSGMRKMKKSKGGKVKW